MKPVIDYDLCIGCGLCEDACPDVYELREDGVVYVIRDNPGHELYGAVRDTVEMCPVDAISIVE